MSGKSNIEWTDHTWNPIVGCSIVSPGCAHCYAMQMAARIEAMGTQRRYVGTTRKVNGAAVWTGKLAQAPANVWTGPLKRQKPTTYFVNSMGDLFHEDCPDEWIDRVFAVMALAPQHTFQVLTKRAERMRQWFAGDRADSVGLAMLTIVDRIPHGHRRVPWPLPNVWLGVSTERQQEADARIPLLLQTPAAVRFISAEPLLGRISLHALNLATPSPSNALRGVQCVPDDSPEGYHNEPTNKLDWVIVGGESGPKARPMHPDWARSLRDQCAAAGVAFFFKQWGEFHPADAHEGTDCASTPEAIHVDGGREFRPSEQFRLITSKAPGWAGMCRVGKGRAGRVLDDALHDDMPERRA